MLKTLELRFWTGAGGYPLGAEYKVLRSVVDSNASFDEQIEKVLQDNNYNDYLVANEVEMIYVD
jgi:hypothetical protein